MPSVGFCVFSEGSDFKNFAVNDNADRPEFNPDRNGLNVVFFANFHQLVRAQICCQVKVKPLDSRQSIAHGAADKAQNPAVIFNNPKQFKNFLVPDNFAHIKIFISQHLKSSLAFCSEINIFYINFKYYYRKITIL